MTGIGENTLAQPVKPPLRERRACLAKLVKNRLTLTVITTNLEFSRWGSVFGDDQMAAVIDRIVHHGRLVQFRGESYRVRHALMQEG